MSENSANPHWGSTLDDFLDEEGIREEATTAAIKRVIAWQLAEEMRRKSITKKRLADLMHPSRAQIDRILDPDKGNVTIETLQRAAALLGRQLRLELLRTPTRHSNFSSLTRHRSFALSEVSGASERPIM